jgi:hypothetical protein
MMEKVKLLERDKESLIKEWTKKDEENHKVIEEKEN